MQILGKESSLIENVNVKSEIKYYLTILWSLFSESFLTLFATCTYEFLISLYLRLNQFSVLVTDMPVPVTAEYFVVSFLNNKGFVTAVKFLVHVAETIRFEQILKIWVEVVILRLDELFLFFQKFTNL